MGSESLLGAWGVRRAASAGSFPATQAAGVTVQSRRTSRRKSGLCGRGRVGSRMRFGQLSSCGPKRIGLQSSSVDAPGWRDVQWCARSRSNGLIRRLHPKQSSFAEIGEEELKRIELFLNDRPQKCLGWMTPREKLAPSLATPRDERSIIENLPPRDTVLPVPLWGTPAGTGSPVSLGGTASRHTSLACLFTITTPFSHLAPT